MRSRSHTMLVLLFIAPMILLVAACNGNRNTTGQTPPPQDMSSAPLDAVSSTRDERRPATKDVATTRGNEGSVNALQPATTRTEAKRSDDAGRGLGAGEMVRTTTTAREQQAHSQTPNGYKSTAPRTATTDEERNRRKSGSDQLSSLMGSNQTISIPIPQGPVTFNQPVNVDRNVKGAVADTATATTQENVSGESYNQIFENQFQSAAQSKLSTFSIDVDAGAYSNIRRFVNSRMLPPPDAVRIEEMINYFRYDYKQPDGNDPFSITTEVAACPWNTKHQLVLIGLQGKTMKGNELPPNNLVFLIDVSGSMNSANKLPLVKESLRMLVDGLRAEDKVALVVYAGNAGLVLPSTPGSDKQKILEAIDRLEAGGSTAGGAGIELAYKTARENFIRDGNNRVILATDGDFNVGISDQNGLVSLIEQKRKEGVFLTTLGFGTGNLQDSKMEQLADKGNGHYAYIDTRNEAKKVFVEEMGATLLAIAKDVKLQIEFNPALVRSYRLIGYENRMLATEDFDDDTKDAGELGAGHSVTALYEVELQSGAQAPIPGQPDLDADKPIDLDGFKPVSFTKNQLMAVKLRYKHPDSDRSNLIIGPAIANERSIEGASDNMKFAAAVAQWGLLLRNSQHKGTASYDNVLKLATAAKGNDAEGYRAEFIQLVSAAKGF